MSLPKKIKQYKIANEEFLAAKAAEQGVKVLDNGVILKQLEQGSGSVHPSPKSVVFVRYTGRLINGKVFDSNADAPLPACFILGQLIMGLQIALTRMVAGDRYEVTIPAQYGYGSRPAGDIPAYSTLVFEIQLIKTEG